MCGKNNLNFVNCQQLTPEVSITYLSLERKAKIPEGFDKKDHLPDGQMGQRNSICEAAIVIKNPRRDFFTIIIIIIKIFRFIFIIIRGLGCSLPKSLQGTYFTSIYCSVFARKEWTKQRKEWTKQRKEWTKQHKKRG